MVQLLKHDNIDWDVVQKILHDSTGGQVMDPFMAEEYPENERHVALLALKEKQLLVISRALRLVSYISDKNSGVEIKKYLKQAYIELGAESKYELLPLFFSPDMLTANSVYIDDMSTRDEAFRAYKSLIQDDGLSLRDLKKDYMEFEHFAYLLPINSYLPGSEDIDLKDNVEQKVQLPSKKKQEQSQNSAKEVKNRIISNVKVIAAPQRAYFNRNTRVDYGYGLGELIEADNVFVRFVDEDENIGIKTSKPSVISRLFLDNGERISSSGQNICEITELDHYDYRQLLEKRKKHEEAVKSERQPDSPSKAKQLASEPRNVENRLKDLKKLYAKKLISKAVYEKKQDEILSDL